MVDSLTFFNGSASPVPKPSILLPDERAINSEHVKTSDCIDCTISSNLTPHHLLSIWQATCWSLTQWGCLSSLRFLTWSLTWCAGSSRPWHRRALPWCRNQLAWSPSSMAWTPSQGEAQNWQTDRLYHKICSVSFLETFEDGFESSVLPSNFSLCRKKNSTLPTWECTIDL